MKTNNIHKLIELFYEGETTPEQEQEIYQYFINEDIADELRQEKEIFLNLYLLQKDKENMPDDFKTELESMVDKLADKERKNPKKISIWKWAGGIAASLLIIAGIGLYYNENDRKHERLLVDTYSDPQEAYRETQKVFELMAYKMNKGLSELERVEKDLSKKNEFINQKLNIK